MTERTDLVMRFFEAANYAAIQAVTTPVPNGLYLDLTTIQEDGTPTWATGTVYYWNGSVWGIYGGPRNLPH